MIWYLDERYAALRASEMRQVAARERLSHLAQEPLRLRLARLLRRWAARLDAASKAPDTGVPGASGAAGGPGSVFPAA